MISAQEAVQAGFEYLKNLYAHELEGLDLEEIELAKDQQYWLVTLGYWKNKPKDRPEQVNPVPSIPNPLVLHVPSANVIRVYKTIKIDAQSGEPISMKIREE